MLAHNRDKAPSRAVTYNHRLLTAETCRLIKKSSDNIVSPIKKKKIVLDQIVSSNNTDDKTPTNENKRLFLAASYLNPSSVFAIYRKYGKNQNYLSRQTIFPLCPAEEPINVNDDVFDH